MDIYDWDSTISSLSRERSARIKSRDFRRPPGFVSMVGARFAGAVDPSVRGSGLQLGRRLGLQLRWQLGLQLGLQLGARKRTVILL